MRDILCASCAKIVFISYFLSHEFVFSALLTLLLKFDGEKRSITMNFIYRRLVFKVVMKGVNKDVTHYLNDFQFGVGVSVCAEVIFSANRVLNK